MSECEVCGKSVSDPKRIELDGVMLDVCENCLKLGREIPKERLRVVLKRRSKESEGFEELTKDVVSDFSRRIREAREAINLKQEEAAQRMGISPSLLRRIENGFRPDDKTLRKIERFYGIKLYED